MKAAKVAGPPSNPRPLPGPGIEGRNGGYEESITHWKYRTRLCIKRSLYDEFFLTMSRRLWGSSTAHPAAWRIAAWGCHPGGEFGGSLAMRGRMIQIRNRITLENAPFWSNLNKYIVSEYTDWQGLRFHDR